MPTHRRNHYVPRFYLKNFATSSGRRIHLFNIPSGRNVLNASLRDQCYGSRFYGNDPSIEQGLADLEEATAAVFRDILRTQRLPKRGSEHHRTLMAFTVTQHARTQRSAATTDAMTDGMLKAAHREDPRFKDFDFEKRGFHFENSVLLPLAVADRDYPVTLDLHLHRIKPLIPSSIGWDNHRKLQTAFTVQLRLRRQRFPTFRNRRTGDRLDCNAIIS